MSKISRNKYGFPVENTEEGRLLPWLDRYKYVFGVAVFVAALVVSYMALR
jgi:hypothetical protein